MKYPDVLDEWETLNRVLAGESLARYGDGELKLMMRRRCVSQEVVSGITSELQNIIGSPNTKALVGIPTLNKASPKYGSWLSLSARFEPFLCNRVYHSSFVTRPDSAPWIGTPDFFDAIESLWKGQRVTFVGNGVRSLTPKFLESTGAAKVDWVECSYAHSYEQIDKLMKNAVRKGNNRVLLCAGPTATCMAERLAQAGHHAVDLGHIGMFWRRYDEFGTWKEGREIDKATGVVNPNRKQK